MLSQCVWRAYNVFGLWTWPYVWLISIINQFISWTRYKYKQSKAQSVEQQDIQGSQGALTVAFETLSNKHKMKT